MVKSWLPHHPSRTRWIAAILAVSMTLAGCSLKKWWGEDQAPEPGSISHASKGEPCPPAMTILEGDDSSSRATLECWIKQTGPLWTDIHGKRRDELTDKELAILVRNHVIELPGDTEKNISKIYAIKKLLSIPDKLTRKDLDNWIDWARKTRPYLQRSYQKIILRKDTLSYADLQVGVSASASLLVQLKWKMPTEELAQTLLTALEFPNPFVKKALPELLTASHNLASVVCPTISEPGQWVPIEIASCLHKMIREFEGGAAWIQFAMNKVKDPINRGELEPSLEAMHDAVDRWFSQPELRPLQPRLFTRLGDQMNVPPEEGLEQSLRWVTRFDSKSTPLSIHPAFFKRAFEVIYRFQKSTFEGIPSFFEATKLGQCENSTSVAYWTDCVLPIRKPLRNIPSFDLVLRIRNLNYGKAVVPLTGAEYSRILFYYELAHEIVEAFDRNGDHWITSGKGGDTEGGPDELLDLLDMGIETGDSVMNYLKNMTMRLQNKAVAEHKPLSATIGHLNRKGIAELITLSGDILVQKSPKDKDLLASLMANFQGSPTSTLHLNQTMLAGIIHLLTSLGTYRDAYLGAKDGRDIPANYEPHQDGPTAEHLVRRDIVIDSLPAVLTRIFPRTARSCEKFGFKKSCTLAFDAILPHFSGDPDFINEADLDLITVIAVGMESLLDHCDQDKNDLLGWNLFDGADELDCGFVKIKDVVDRLIDSNIIREKGVQSILSMVNSNFVTRVIGKIAMARGKKDGAAWRLPIFWRYNDASIGSMYGLLGDAVADDALKKKIKQRPE